MDTTRRNFLRSAAAAGTALITAPSILASAVDAKPLKAKDASSPFRLKYAPSMNMFKGHVGTNPVDNIKFSHDMGFTAMFDNGIMDRPVGEQDKIAKELQRLGMDFGPFVLYSDFEVTSFVLKDPEVRTMLVNKMKEGVEVAKRIGAKWALVVPGRFDEKLHPDFQTANIIDNLRHCCEVVEPSGLILVLEPLNTLVNHPGLFLKGIPQTYVICRAVNNPSCKIVDDFYHQQITEGNLIANMETAWDEIGAFHIGDTPGRKEPTTGEINYKNVFKYIYKRNYQGVLCMEHGISGAGKEGEARLIQAYRECDDY